MKSLCNVACRACASFFCQLTYAPCGFRLQGFQTSHSSASFSSCCCDSAGKACQFGDGEVKVIESALTDATAIDVESELDITMFHHGPSLDSITLLEASLVSFAREVNVANVSEAIVSFCVPGSARNPQRPPREPGPKNARGAPAGG